jgi:hypothetical protein
MPWFAICEIVGGRLESVATIVADPLPPQLESIPLSSQPDFAVDRWDTATKTMVPKPAPPPPRDRVDDIMNQSEMLLLNTLNRDRARTAIIRVLNEPELRYY